MINTFNVQLPISNKTNPDLSKENAPNVSNCPITQNAPNDSKGCRWLFSNTLYF